MFYGRPSFPWHRAYRLAAYEVRERTGHLHQSVLCIEGDLKGKLFPADVAFAQLLDIGIYSK